MDHDRNMTMLRCHDNGNRHEASFGKDNAGLQFFHQPDGLSVSFDYTEGIAEILDVKITAELSGCDGIFARLLSAASDPLNGGERCSLLVYEYILEARSVLLGGAKRPGGQSDRAVEFI